jgi:hypothetical protein
MTTTSIQKSKTRQTKPSSVYNKQKGKITVKKLVERKAPESVKRMMIE